MSSHASSFEHSGYIDQSVVKLTEFEGSVRWLYMDTRGLVTVGVGEMLANPAAACQLPFQSPRATVATSEEIISDYWRVKAMQPGLSAAAYYEDSVSVELLAADIANILRRHVVYFDGALRQFYAGYDGFPNMVKLALLDLVFNLGVSKLEKTYPAFNTAIRHRDWLAAAQQCHRNGPSEGRNSWCRDQFLLASQAAQPITGIAGGISS